MVASYNVEVLPLFLVSAKGVHTCSLNHSSKAFKSKQISSTLPFCDRVIASHRLNHPYFTLRRRQTASYAYGKE